MANTRKRDFLPGAVIASLLLIIILFAAESIKNRNMEKSIHINEVMSSNLSTVSDNRGSHPDWIEIYNSAGSGVNLKGFTLRTGERGTGVYSFPDIELGPKQFLIVFMSEKYLSDDHPEESDSGFSLKDFIITGRGMPEKKGSTSEETGGMLYVPLKLSSAGTRVLLYGKTDSLVDEIEIPALRYDVSYARAGDGTGDFELLSPSPGKSNNGAQKLIIPTRNSLRFSKESGFYDEAFKLEITDNRASKIFYTTDGSDPIKNGVLYTGPVEITDPSGDDNRYADIKEISCFFVDDTSVQIKDEEIYAMPSEKVDKAAVIRATSVGEDGSWSEIRTGVYFIGYDKKKEYKNIPVMSLIADPDDLFGYEKGIYVTGKTMDDYLVRENEDNVTPWSDANYRNRGIEWEREAVMTYFDAGKTLQAEQQTGIRIKGNWSRAYPQKSLNIYARKEYGSDIFDTVFFDDDRYESVITMFNGGNDASYKLEDVLASDMAAGEEAHNGVSGEEALKFSVMRHYPCYLFLNGEYWGIMDLSEKFDEEYISRKFGVAPENVVMIKNLELEAGREEDYRLYEQLRYLVYTGEFDKEENFKKFCECVDIDSFLDYYAFRIYIGNRNDWPARNFALWRVRDKGSGLYEDGKWRFMLFDVNNKCMDPSDLTDGFDLTGYVREGDNMFDELMKNRDFEKRFYERLNELSETNCSPENVRKLAENRRNILEEPMKGWYKRFADDASLISMFNSRVDSIINFFEIRRSTMHI